MAVGPEAAAERLRLYPGEPLPPVHPICVRESGETVEIDTGAMRCSFPRGGDSVLGSIHLGGALALGSGGLLCLCQDRPEDSLEGPYSVERYDGRAESVVVEQTGPVRAVARVEGFHVNRGGRAWLPFVLRFYLFAGAEAIRVVHTIVFDGDPDKDFIRGLGLRFQVPFRDPPHDRHVRFVGQDGGLWAEAVQGLTGLRRDPGHDFRSAQMDGAPTPPIDGLPPHIRSRLRYVPAWSDYELAQLSADGFQIRKRTAGDTAWIHADGGARAEGVGYVGGARGGAGFGIRDFWRKHPAQIDVRGAATDTAEVTLWLYAPSAPAMDLRPYHDGMGMRTHAEQLQGLEITYEDYEEGYDTPVGVARTSEMTLRPAPATPSRSRLLEWADCSSVPPILVCDPSHYMRAGVFGGLFGPVDRSSPAKARIDRSSPSPMACEGRGDEVR